MKQWTEKDTEPSSPFRTPNSPLTKQNFPLKLSRDHVASEQSDVLKLKCATCSEYISEDIREIHSKYCGPDHPMTGDEITSEIRKLNFSISHLSKTSSLAPAEQGLLRTLLIKSQSLLTFKYYYTETAETTESLNSLLSPRISLHPYVAQLHFLGAQQASLLLKQSHALKLNSCSGVSKFRQQSTRSRVKRISSLHIPKHSLTAISSELDSPPCTTTPRLLPSPTHAFYCLCLSLKLSTQSSSAPIPELYSLALSQKIPASQWQRFILRHLTKGSSPVRRARQETSFDPGSILL